MISSSNKVPPRQRKRPPKKRHPILDWVPVRSVLSVLRRFRFPTDGDVVARSIVCALLVILVTLLQTTIFTRFRPFGAIPDLMLALVVAIGMSEGEKWGAVWGLIASYTIEAIGTIGFTLLPILYMPLGYLCPIVTRLYLKDSIPVRAMYMLAACMGRAAMTLIYLALTQTDFSLFSLLATIVIPEFASTFLLAFVPHLLAYRALRTFHKPRAERVTTL